MLGFIPSRPDYDDWLRISSAVWSVLDETTGITLLNEWSPEEKPGEYTRKFKNRLRDVRIGTLAWQHIKRIQNTKGTQGPRGHIEVPAQISKVRKRRLVPILPTLAAWLDRIQPPATGIICPRHPAEHITKDLGGAVGRWRKNASRHTYGSWRAAETNDLPALALEMGTSYAMIEKHYREAVSAAHSATYRFLTPSEVFRKQSTPP